MLFMSERYALSNRLSKLTKLRIIVIYTADISSACDCYDLVPRCINSRVNITRYPRPLPGGYPLCP